jgi:hypothetical protein
MSFCWFTSFIGYPNFFQESGRGAELAKAFFTLAEAAQAGLPYHRAKEQFSDLDPHQVETKKAAFQEFGLLYVVPRSNRLTLTPLGHQVLELSSDTDRAQRNRRTILLALAHGLSRYQFNNPLPVGGNKAAFRARARSSDVLPYLACFYLLHKLDGILTVSELRGAIFGLQRMSSLRDLERLIRKQRILGTPFRDLPALPANRRTADNLKIYFVSHLGLDNEILMLSAIPGPYGGQDQILELTKLGHEITESVLGAEWPDWQSGTSPVPNAKAFPTIESYFSSGVGAVCSQETIKSDLKVSRRSIAPDLQAALDEQDIEGIKNQPRRQYEEGRQRLIKHLRLEKARSSSLVRDAKRTFKTNHGRLSCEVCGFDYANAYGERGKDFIEAHHRQPISELPGTVRLRIEDLAMVCANCHRMLHRPPWITMEELRLGLTSS